MKQKKTQARKKGPAATRPKKAAGRGSPRQARKREIRKARPVKFWTTEEIELRTAPSFTAPPLPGGRLRRGTLLQMAPQDWWYVEVFTPATASGTLRGWIPNSILRRASALEEKLPLPDPTRAKSDTRAQLRTEIARAILNFEARRDAQDHLKVYLLPPNDGGGRYEIAGINERYHPREAARLRDLIEAGRFAEAEAEATEFIASYTDIVARWTSVAEIEAYLRDCAFNRGPGGAAKILQLALGVKADGLVGPVTLGALGQSEKEPAGLLRALRAAREAYELRAVGRRENFWAGLKQRWDEALAFAQTLPRTTRRPRTRSA